MEEAEGRTLFISGSAGIREGLCDTCSIFQDVFVGTEKFVNFLATKKFWKVSDCHCYDWWKTNISFSNRVCKPRVAQVNEPGKFEKIEFFF